jgi:hypothetical protein
MMRRGGLLSRMAYSIGIALGGFGNQVKAYDGSVPFGGYPVIPLVSETAGISRHVPHQGAKERARRARAC